MLKKTTKTTHVNEKKNKSTNTTSKTEDWYHEPNKNWVYHMQSLTVYTDPISHVAHNMLKIKYKVADDSNNVMTQCDGINIVVTISIFV